MRKVVEGILKNLFRAGLGIKCDLCHKNRAVTIKINPWTKQIMKVCLPCSMLKHW